MPSSPENSDGRAALSKRISVPPKRDDFILTWTEHQQLRKALLASLSSSKPSSLDDEDQKLDSIRQITVGSFLSNNSFTSGRITDSVLNYAARKSASLYSAGHQVLADEEDEEKPKISQLMLKDADQSPRMLCPNTEDFITYCSFFGSILMPEEVNMFDNVTWKPVYSAPPLKVKQNGDASSSLVEVKLRKLEAPRPKRPYHRRVPLPKPSERRKSTSKPRGRQSSRKRTHGSAAAHKIRAKYTKRKSKHKPKKCEC
ncbi:unnamed protein product [Soboliphyme baturini]|uniref:Uncharacterized protein n=1 Tax=Soboliphyme baturini TaxID=241478 RepID=A0A183J0L0_9BILA|nr:unnamed protein product [Soboliphyme baturini]